MNEGIGETGPRGDGNGDPSPVGVSIPTRWQREGLVLEGVEGEWGSFVMGDPCLVRDEDAGLWRMFLFALPPGHGQATTAGDPANPAGWRFDGPLTFTNPEALEGRMVFKPFVVLDPERPGHAARIDGFYALLLGTDIEPKVLRRAWSPSLAGPWTVEATALLECGADDDFDARHVDAVSAWLFAGRGEVLYFYMGYPLRPQAGRSVSPLGSAQGAATESVDAAAARARATLGGRTPPPASVQKLGVVLPPSPLAGHWASGWVGGLQLLRGRDTRWIGLVNASPTPPRADDTSLSREEPPPSLGGFAVCDEPFPVSGWRWCEQPIERPEDVPVEARQAGEVVNFWRHHALVLEDGRLAVFYNAGDYFQEKLFLRIACEAPENTRP